MGSVLLDEESKPTSPASGQSLLYPDNAASSLLYIDDSGRVQGTITKRAVAAATLAAADAYVTGSGILVPSSGLQAQTRYTVRFDVTKTGAGVAAPVYTIRLGTAGSTADTALLALTGVAQTGIVESAWFELEVTFRSTAACTAALICTRTGGTAATGIAAVPVQLGTSGAIVTTWAAGQTLGLSINAGGSSAWTLQQVQTELDM